MRHYCQSRSLIVRQLAIYVGRSPSHFVKLSLTLSHTCCQHSCLTGITKSGVCLKTRALGVKSENIFDVSLVFALFSVAVSWENDEIFWRA